MVINNTRMGHGQSARYCTYINCFWDCRIIQVFSNNPNARLLLASFVKCALSLLLEGHNPDCCFSPLLGSVISNPTYFIYPSRINISYVHLLYPPYANHILKRTFEFLQISNVSVDLVWSLRCFDLPYPAWELHHFSTAVSYFNHAPTFRVSCRGNRKPWLIGTYDQFVKLSVRGDGGFYPSYHNAEAMSLFQCFDHRSMRFLVPLQKVIRLHDWPTSSVCHLISSR